MLKEVFFIGVLVLQCILSYEIDEYDIVPKELAAVEDDYEDSLIPILKTSAIDHENVIIDEEVETEDEGSNENKSEEDTVAFAGPVKARGSVAVAANFGYDAPGSFNFPFSTINPLLPPYFPHYFFPPSPLSYPMPFSFPYMPIVATFLPGIAYTEENSAKTRNKDGISENLTININSKEINKEKSGKKDIYVEILPVKKAKKAKENNENVTKLCEEVTLEDSQSPVLFLEEESTDNKAVVDETEVKEEDTKKEEEESDSDGVVFGGFVPASGSVRIAARF